MSFLLVLLVIAFPLLALSFAIVNQGTVAVVTIFGKYQRIMTPGLNFKIPLLKQSLKNLYSKSFD
jgi:regulator of protease activity HflC (stomatin/prohibitin superfamily)